MVRRERVCRHRAPPRGRGRLRVVELPGQPDRGGLPRPRLSLLRRELRRGAHRPEPDGRGRMRARHADRGRAGRTGGRSAERLPARRLPAARFPLRPVLRRHLADVLLRAHRVPDRAGRAGPRRPRPGAAVWCLPGVDDTHPPGFSRLPARTHARMGGERIAAAGAAGAALRRVPVRLLGSRPAVGLSQPPGLRSPHDRQRLLGDAVARQPRVGERRARRSDTLDCGHDPLGGTSTACFPSSGSAS